MDYIAIGKVFTIIMFYAIGFVILSEILYWSYYFILSEERPRHFFWSRFFGKYGKELELDEEWFPLPFYFAFLIIGSIFALLLHFIWAPILLILVFISILFTLRWLVKRKRKENGK